MGKSTIAIGEDGNVSLWCMGNAKRFHVINGAWEGRLKDGRIFVIGYDSPKTAGHGEIIWEGTVPHPHSKCYNEAIRWIQAEVDRIRSERLL